MLTLCLSRGLSRGPRRLRRLPRVALVFAATASFACGQPADIAPAPATSAAPVAAAVATPALPARPTAALASTLAASRDTAPPFVGGEKAFASVKETLLHGYGGGTVTEDELYRAAVQGMLEHVDPSRGAWNRLMSPDEHEALHSDLEGQLVGIGAEVDFEDTTGYTYVVGVFAASPAERAGLKPGDVILDVNGKLFKGKSIRDVLAEIRGKAGETVTLTVLRADAVLTLPIVREVISYEVVRDMMLDDGVGYLRIKSFNGKTRPGVDRALDDLAAHAATSLVVDLRGNPGGGFDDAIATAEALVPAGTVIARIHKPGEAEKALTATKGATVLAGVPMVVLVDGDTSSGGEVVASALHHGRHAQLVGSKTFGKWSLQTVDDLPNGYAVKYTISVIQDGEGKTHDGVGVLPDIQVDLDKRASAAAQQELDPSKRLSVDSPLRTAVGVVVKR